MGFTITDNGLRVLRIPTEASARHFFQSHMDIGSEYRERLGQRPLLQNADDPTSVITICRNVAMVYNINQRDQTLRYTTVANKAAGRLKSKRLARQSLEPFSRSLRPVQHPAHR